jgi:hypothetical protein
VVFVKMVPESIFSETGRKQLIALPLLEREAMVTEIRVLVRQLALPYRATLEVFFGHLFHVVRNQSMTKMSAKNLSSVFFPPELRSVGEFMITNYFAIFSNGNAPPPDDDDEVEGISEVPSSAFNTKALEANERNIMYSRQRGAQPAANPQPQLATREGYGSAVWRRVAAMTPVNFGRSRNDPAIRSSRPQKYPVHASADAAYAPYPPRKSGELTATSAPPKGPAQSWDEYRAMSPTKIWAGAKARRAAQDAQRHNPRPAQSYNHQATRYNNGANRASAGNRYRASAPAITKPRGEQLMMSYPPASRNPDNGRLGTTAEMVSAFSGGEDTQSFYHTNNNFS